MWVIRIFLALALICMPSQVWAEKRVALVIGNSAYQHAPGLTNPTNDAEDMVRKLESLGFEVVAGKDLDLNGMRRTIKDFVDRLDGTKLAVFYYSGHGLQVDGVNYLDRSMRSWLDKAISTSRPCRWI